jgi:hypothetical protein
MDVLSSPAQVPNRLILFGGRMNLAQKPRA